MSTKPGAAAKPRASMTRRAVAGVTSRPTPTIRSPRTATFASTGGLPPPSKTHAPRIKRSAVIQRPFGPLRPPTSLWYQEDLPHLQRAIPADHIPVRLIQPGPLVGIPVDLRPGGDPLQGVSPLDHIAKVGGQKGRRGGCDLLSDLRHLVLHPLPPRLRGTGRLLDRAKLHVQAIHLRASPLRLLLRRLGACHRLLQFGRELGGGRGRGGRGGG